MRVALDRALLWIGRRRALPAALLLTVGLVAAAVVLDGTALHATSLTLLAAYGGYCLLRPVRRADAFWPLFAPGPVAALAEALLGIPEPYVAVPLLLLALGCLWSLDRQDARERVRSPAQAPAPRSS